MDITFKQLTVLLVLGFFVVAFSAVSPSFAHADDETMDMEEYMEDPDNKALSEKIEQEHQKNLSELEKIKAQTQVNYESRVDTTTGPQSYFDDPEPEAPVAEEPEAAKTYRYEKQDSRPAPDRLFNNVQ